MKNIEAIVACLLVCTSSGAQESPLPRGGAFFVNVSLPGSQRNPDVAADGSNNFQVVWQTSTGDPVHVDVRIRRLLANGTNLAELPLAQSTTRDQLDPSIAMEADGDWAAIWTSDHGEEGEGRPIGRATSEGGTVLGDEFAFTTDNVDDVIGTDVALVGEEDLVGAWRNNASAVEITANFRSRKGDDFGLAEVATGTAVALAGLGGDDWALVWHAPDADQNGVFLRCHEAEQEAQEELQVHGDRDGEQRRPDVAALGSGRFVAVWQNLEAVVGRLFLRREDGSCAAAGAQFAISEPGEPGQSPRVAAGADGAFVVVWSEGAADADGIAAREFEHDATPVGEPFAVLDPTPGLQNGPAVAVSSSLFAVVWNHADDADPVDRNVAAKVFFRRLVFSDDFELDDLARWSDTGP